MDWIGHHRISTLARLTIATLIALPVVITYGMHSITHSLDQQVRAQCAANDWPISQDAAHRNFCRTYLISAQP